MEHPKLLFSPEELPEIRARLRGPRGRKLLNHAVRYCERYLAPGDELYFDFRELRNGYWHTRQGNFIVPGHMAALSLIGWLADRREFRETARDALLAVIEKRLADQLDPGFGRSPHFYPGWRLNANHDAGKFFFTLGFLCDTLADILSADQRRSVLMYADETLRIGQDNLAKAVGQGVDNNRGGRFTTGLCVLGAAIEAEPGVDTALAKCLADEGPKRLERALRWGFGHDGEPYEGNGYGPGTLQFYLLCAEVLARVGRRDLRHDARFNALSDYLAYELVVADGFFNNQNDCSVDQPAQTLLWSGCRHKRPGTLWVWDQTAGKDGHPCCMTREGAHAVNLLDVPWALLWIDDATAPCRPDSCGYPLARHFRERGIVALRTGWEPSSLHATLFSGRQGHTAHCHHDLNQVTFYALGERFIVDIGYSTEDPRTGDPLPGWPAEAHNLVSVDEQVQRGRHTNDWAEGRILAFENCLDYAYVVGDARESLGSVLRNDRHLLLSRRPGTAPYLIWIDDVRVDTADVEHDFRLFLHTAPGNRFCLGDDRVSIEGAQALMDIHIANALRAPGLSVSAYGPFPRLEMMQRSVRGRFVLLMHPRRADEASAQFRLVRSDDAVEVEVILSGARHAYQFKTAPCGGSSSRDERPAVAILA